MDELEQRIATRLREAAGTAERTGVEVAAPAYGHGLAVHGDEYADPIVVLTLDEVASLAAAEARAWF